MGGDLPDYSRQITVLLNADIMAQTRSLPWWIRYAPSRVLYLDDIEGVLKWLQTAGTLTKYSGTEVFEGNYCLKMVTGAAADSEAGAQIILGGVPKSKFAVQLKWLAYADNEQTLRSFDINIALLYGAQADYVKLQFLQNLTTPQFKWRYQDENGIMSDIPNASELLYVGLKQKRSLYFTFDTRPSQPVFSRLRTDSLDLDISSCKILRLNNGYSPTLYINPVFTTDLDAVVEGYIDAFCLSDQEA